MAAERSGGRKTNVSLSPCALTGHPVLIRVALSTRYGMQRAPEAWMKLPATE